VSRPSGEAARWIERLALVPHPEGGYFRETYRAAESIAAAALPARYAGARAFATAIHFLLPSAEVSALHRLRSDELWFFQAGSALTLVLLDDAGTLEEVTLGTAVERGERLQASVRAGVWFGAMVTMPGSFALLGCVVAPGFEFADFELAERAALVRRFPRHRATIERLTRAGGTRRDA
jgi:predicted cupin superfamily sugar epimerase